MLIEGLLGLGLEKDLVCVTVGRLEADRRGHVEVVVESRDMQEHRVAVLYAGVSSDEDWWILRTSVTPKSLTLALPPLSAPSSVSIAWKIRFCVISLKSGGSAGRRHCWSFSVLLSFSVSRSCVIFSSVSSNWLGAAWLELKEPLMTLGGPFLTLPLSSLIFFAERGDACTFARLFEASARARLAGVRVAVPTIFAVGGGKT